MQTTNALAELIQGAVSKGFTRSDLAGAVGCSRMQLWRLENGFSPPSSKAGRRLQRILTEGLGDAASSEIIQELALGLDSAPPEVRDEALKMLHSLARLLHRR